jgi:hypothetical protein
VLKLCLREFETLSPNANAQSALEAPSQEQFDWHNWSMGQKIVLDTVEWPDEWLVATRPSRATKNGTQASVGRRTIGSPERLPRRR